MIIIIIYYSLWVFRCASICSTYLGQSVHQNARNSVAAELRFYKQPNCVNQTWNSVYLVEDEMHFMLNYSKKYAKLRSDLFQKVKSGFSQLTDHLQFKHLLTCDNLARFIGQYGIDAFDQRLVS